MPRVSHIRIRRVHRDDDPKCITCGHRRAIYPAQAASPRFCTKKCAAFYGTIIANDWAWCRTHRTYWDRLVYDGCTECKVYRRRAGSAEATLGERFKQAYGDW